VTLINRNNDAGCFCLGVDFNADAVGTVNPPSFVSMSISISIQEGGTLSRISIVAFGKTRQRLTHLEAPCSNRLE